ncbi:MAG TPA: PAS domain S-box protein [Candidatus Polarisedimenticolaceae bacterium]|nr:PAS domain S-box protein [Candidatus Polarisedimenticolaceae bacterium]
MSELRSDGRRKSDEALRLSEERYRRLVDMSPDAVFIVQGGLVRFVNPAALKLLGITHEERVIGRLVFDLFHPDDHPALMARYQEVIQGAREPGFIERRYRRPDGSTIDIEVAATLYPDPDGASVQFIVRDVTDRKRALEALRQSEEQFRQIAETIDEVFWSTSADKNRMVYVSPAYEKIWGRPCAELYANPRQWLVGVHPDDRDAVIHAALTKQADGKYDEEYRIIRPDGSIRWVRDRAFPLRDDAGEIYRIVGLAEDISDRKRVGDELRALSEQLEARVVERTAQLREANESLRKAEARQRALLNAIPDLVFRVRRDGTYLDFSAPSGAEATMSDRLIGSNIGSSDLPPAVRATLLDGIARAVDTGTPVALEYTVDGDADARTFEARLVRSGPEEVVATVRDITRRREAEAQRERLEQQLRQSQKMEAIGTLAGGIAHDFNNILTAIIGYTELLRNQLRGQMGVEERLAEISRAGARAKDLVSQILTFSRRQDHTRAPTAMAPAIDEALRLLRAAIPASIEIDWAIDHDLPPVLADATQIHQIVMNLAANAAAAMGNGPGKLRVVCASVTLDDDAARLHPDLRPGEWVRLDVQDTGCGIPPEMLDRIFDPFFTTKGPGEGTGLGLSVVHGIVKAHDGAVLVESEPGVGTAFHIYFPALETRHSAPARPGPQAAGGRGEHILYVDDEPSLVELLKAQLEMLGYRVTACESSVEALATFKAAPLDFDVLITDLTMPGMSGAELAEAALKIRPNLPVVVATGYGHVMGENKARALGLRRVLNKPFSMAVLDEAIQEALATR